MTAVSQTRRVLAEVRIERVRQDLKWGEQNHPDGTGADIRVLRSTDVNLDLRTGHELADIFKAKCRSNRLGRDTWRDILLEEVFEVMAESDPAPLRAELIQVAAVAVQWVEAIDRRNQGEPPDCSTSRHSTWPTRSGHREGRIRRHVERGLRASRIA